MTYTNSTQTVSNKYEYKEDSVDQLTKKAAQLSAMLTTTYGGGFESFDSYNATIKQNYLWACAELAQDIEKLSIAIAMQ